MIIVDVIVICVLILFVVGDVIVYLVKGDVLIFIDVGLNIKEVVVVF